MNQKDHWISIRMLRSVIEMTLLTMKKKKKGIQIMPLIHQVMIHLQC